MAGSKATIIWIVNLVSFILFGVLSLSGMINWLIVPRGPVAREGALISLRHVIRDVHTWTELVFVLVIAVHLGLHVPYIRDKIKRTGRINGPGR